ncbi:MAG: RluA family pseudouridine synthase [bacterium]
MNFTIAETENNTRLDKYLVGALPELSRNQIQKLIEENLVMVNEVGQKSNYRLKTADIVTIVSTSRAEKVAKEYDHSIFELITIVAETSDYVIINKPAGLIIHGSDFLLEPSLVDWLLKRYPEIINIGDDKQRPGIVHRIDKDVSGMVVIAKTPEAFKHFKKLFAYRRIKKIYTALVFDKVIREKDTIEFVIERSTSGHKMAARPVNQEGKPSISEFEIITRYINYTLLKIQIKTGRTHQIRAHLAAYGHPIVGDNLYGTHRNKLANQKLKTDRIYLVASELSFKDLQGEPQSYKINLPEKFNELLKVIK